MPTLYASVIRLHAITGGQINYDPGEWANAAFYGILSQVDPALATDLHDADGRKPFTISSLASADGGRPGRSGQVVRPGWEYGLRVTTLNEAVFQVFIQRFLQGNGRPQVQLGPLAFAVSEVLTTPGAHPWAGFAQAGQLANQAAPAEHLALEFASPTGFHIRERYELFPQPGYVFGSLAAKWRDFLSPDLDTAYVEDLAGDILVSDFRLQTQTLRWRGRVQKGFTGRCIYDLSHLPLNDRRLLAALANFAFYAGVGGKTTQGMGQARRIDER